MNKLKINNSPQLHQKTDIKGQAASHRTPTPTTTTERNRQVDKESHIRQSSHGAEDQEEEMQEPVLGSFYLVYHVRLAAKNMTRHTKRQKKKTEQ